MNNKSEKLKSIFANKKKRKKTITVAVCIAVIAVEGAAFAVCANRPYEISLNDQSLCYVKNKSAAENVVKTVASSNAYEGTTVKAIDTSGNLKVDIAKPFSVKESDIVSNEQAVEIIGSSLNADNDVTMTVASAKTEIVEYTPEPNYEKDDSMYAGQTVVKKKGKDGKRYQTTTYVTVNGEIKDSQKIDGKIIEEGKKATVVKGTRGLPEGEDWKTFDGNPISPIGDAIVAKGKSFLGTPYSKWDCVDFVRNTYARLGITLPKSHRGLKQVGVGVSFKDAKPGDICCWPAHVAIYLGNGRIIHSISKSGVSYGTVNPNKLVTIRRVIP